MKAENISAKIVQKYLVQNTHDLKSLGGLLVSGIISTFGVYGLIAPFFTTDGVLSSKVYTTLVAFVIVLVIFDTIKRASFTKWLNSILKETILLKKRATSYLIITILSTFFLISLDALGSWTTAELGANLYLQAKTNKSTEFKILEQNAENGKVSATNYKEELKAWKEMKAEAYQNCNDKWAGWKAKYKAKCKTEWGNKHPMPTNTTSGNINIKDYQSIKNQNQGFLDEYLQTILFILLSLLTLLMQYLTISKIHDDYKDIDDSLSDDKIEFIRDDIAEHEQIQAEHEQAVAEMKADATRTKKDLDKEFSRVGEAIGITHKKKRNNTRAKTILRIANNEYVPQEQSRAGFATNPFAETTEEPKTTKELISDLDIQKVFTGINNNGAILAYLYKDYLIQNDRSAIVTKPKKGWLKRDLKMYDGMLYIETSKYNDNHEPLYKGKQTSLYKLIEIVDSLSHKDDNWNTKDKESKITKETNSNLDVETIVRKLWKNGAVKKGDKLLPKNQTINIKSRTQTKLLTSIYKEMVELGYAELRGNKGYYAKIDYNDILEAI